MARFGLKVRPTTNCRSRAGVFCDETAGGAEVLLNAGKCLDFPVA